MYRKSLMTSLFIIAALFAANIGVSAQTFIARGKVEMRQADGTTVPVEGAVVDVFRTDIKSKGVSSKTNKKGEYTFAGLTFGGIFMFAASAPGAAPDIIPDIKGSIEKEFNFVLSAGDGKRLTLEEALAVKTAGTYATSGSEAKLTPEQIKAQQEQQKKIDEVNAKNAKIKNSNEVIDAAVKGGNAAFQAKDYTTAIDKYTEGIQADPEYLGSAPILLNNRAVALRQRAVDHYTKYNKDKDAAEQQAAKADLVASYESAKASYDLVTKSSAASAPEFAANLPKNKTDAMSAIREALRLLAKTRLDVSRMDEISSVYQESITAETLPEKKTALRMEMADIFREAGECDKAVAEYDKVLAEKADDPDALVGSGLCLVNIGFMTDNKDKLQQGLNVLQHFVDVAPDTHKLKTDAKNSIEYLKNEQKLVPQKTTTPKALPKKKP